MKIRKYRLLLDLTQQELADKAGCSKTHICDLENSKRYPSIPLLVHISTILNTCPCELLECRCTNDHD